MTSCNINWNVVPLGKLFTIYTGGDMIISRLKDGDYPLISHSLLDNGVAKYIEKQDDCKLYNHETTISLADRGNFGALVQKQDFYIGTRVKALEFKSEYEKYISKEILLFISTAINKQSVKFSYGNNCTGGAEDLKILLPMTDKDNIDFDYMKAFINNISQRSQEKYVDYCKSKLQILGAPVVLQNVNSKKWVDFYITEVFEKPKRGKRIVEKNHITGDTPLVSSFGQGNGVTNFIGNKDKVKRYTNCLSIANGGSSAGKTFYHPYTFVAADHVTQCWNKDLNEYQYLFLATVMTQALTGKYSFSHEISDPRLAKERIMLPATESGEPDFEYMEKYIKNMIIKKYNSYLNYIQ